MIEWLNYRCKWSATWFKTIRSVKCWATQQQAVYLEKKESLRCGEWEHQTTTLTVSMPNGDIHRYRCLSRQKVSV